MGSQENLIGVIQEFQDTDLGSDFNSTALHGQEANLDNELIKIQDNNFHK